jgi:hypothetical protein
VVVDLLRQHRHEHAKLVSQRRVLEHQAGAAATRETQDSQEQKEQAIHRVLRLRDCGAKRQ